MAHEYKKHYRAPGSGVSNGIGLTLCKLTVPEEQIVLNQHATCLNCLHIWDRTLKEKHDPKHDSRPA